MAARKPLIAGNWKMHGRRAELEEIPALAKAVGPSLAGLEVLVCPPAPYLQAALAAAGPSGIAVGGQD